MKLKYWLRPTILMSSVRYAHGITNIKFVPPLWLHTTCNNTGEKFANIHVCSLKVYFFHRAQTDELACTRGNCDLRHI